LIFKVIFAQKIISEQTNNIFLLVSIIAIIIHVGLTWGVYTKNTWAYFWIAVFTIVYFWNFDFVLVSQAIIDLSLGLYNLFDIINGLIVIISSTQFFLALKRKDKIKRISI
jgi:hypothetical protein